MSELGRDAETGRIRRRAPEALPNIVAIVVSLNRESGKVEVDDEFSTPMETEGMLRVALDIKTAELGLINGTLVEDEDDE